MTEISPNDVCGANFCDSVFQDAQMERFLQLIVAVQHRMNPHAWTPFTWAQYRGACSHKVDHVEHELFEAMVDGGTVEIIDLGTPKNIAISGGYLKKREGMWYEITDKLLEVMKPYATVAA